MNKKAQLDQLFPLVYALVGIGIILTVGFLIFAESKDIVLDKITSGNVNNELVTWNDNTFVALTYSGAGSAEVTCSAVRNNSATKELIGSSNYTCNRGGLNLTDDLITGTWNTTVYVNYTYKNASHAWNGTIDVQNATQTIPGWLSIIVITVIGALLLSLVALFRRR